MFKTRRNFGLGLKGFSMHKEYELPPSLATVMAPEHAEGVRRLVQRRHVAPVEVEAFTAQCYKACVEAANHNGSWEMA